MKLTASQIKYFDEIAIDEQAVESTIKTALTYHSNRMNELLRNQQKLWEELIEFHNLDPYKTWTTKVIDGAVNFVGFAGRILGYIDGLFDSLVVDGLVNGIAHGTAALGRHIRRSQTGRIQTYLMGAVGGVLFLVLINYLLVNFLRL